MLRKTLAVLLAAAVPAAAEAPLINFDGGVGIGAGIPAFILTGAAARPATPKGKSVDPYAKALEAIDRCQATADNQPPAPRPPAPQLLPPRWRVVPQGQLPRFQDDLNARSLLDEAIPRTLAYWRKRPNQTVTIAGVGYTTAEIIRSLEALAALVRAAPDLTTLEAGIESQFDVYQSLPEDPAKGDEGQATSYYTPVLNVKARPDDVATAAVYRLPPGGSSLTRKQIAAGGLSGRGLEIGYAAPIDLMDAQTQGSAWTEIGGRRTLLSYAGTNGQRWRGIAGVLRRCNLVPGDYQDKQRFPVCAQAGWPSMMSCLRTFPGNVQQAFANLDPSFVFFSGSTTGGPTGASGVEVVPGRSIAIDTGYIPMGLPGIAIFRRADGEHARVIFTHDKGGAIRGGARADIYEGEGTQAGAAASATNSPLKLYVFLLKKPSAQPAG